MFAIPMGGVDVVMGAQWLQTLRTFAMNLEEMFIQFREGGVGTKSMDLFQHHLKSSAPTIWKNC